MWASTRAVIVPRIWFNDFRCWKNFRVAALERCLVLSGMGTDKDIIDVNSERTHAVTRCQNKNILLGFNALLTVTAILAYI